MSEGLYGSSSPISQALRRFWKDTASSLGKEEDKAPSAMKAMKGATEWEVSLARKTRPGKGPKEVQGGVGGPGAVLRAQRAPTSGEADSLWACLS